MESAWRINLDGVRNEEVGMETDILKYTENRRPILYGHVEGRRIRGLIV